MNSIFTTGLAILAATTALPAIPAPANPCGGMRIVLSDTDFPMRAQLRGQKGTVFLNVTLDADGHPTSAAIERSSGYRLLDTAATRSVLNKWQFDVSHCDHAFPATHQVAVEYRNEEYQ